MDFLVINPALFLCNFEQLFIIDVGWRPVVRNLPSSQKNAKGKNEDF